MHFILYKPDLTEVAGKRKKPFYHLGTQHSGLDCVLHTWPTYSMVPPASGPISRDVLLPAACELACGRLLESFMERGSY